MMSITFRHIPTTLWQRGATMFASSDRSPSRIVAVGYGDDLECQISAGSGTGGRAH
ncbi:MAG TPA: hypothetical protein VJN70_04510 [Gemmatimonadaceae bacterium]|nr:hypothetical protein [Gemmatimonadaceae bacterium]